MNFNGKLRKGLVSFLVFVLLLSSMPSWANNSSFKDVPKSRWSYDEITKMAELGYIKGRDDGNFDPTGNLTFVESMALLSRFVEPTNSEIRSAMSKHKSFLDGKVKEVWQKEALAVALEKGIVSENEVKNAHKEGIFNRPLQKVAASVFLAKAMGLKDKADALSVVLLDYGDVVKIEPSLRKYIKVLGDAGVIKGDENGNFNPREALRREIMATMMFNGYEYLEKNPEISKPETPKPEEPKEEELETINGKIARITDEIGRKFLVLEDNSEREKSYVIESDTEISIDGRRSSVSDLKKGQKARLRVGKLSRGLKDIKAENVKDDIQGSIIYLSILNNELEIEYNEDGRVKTEKFDVAENIKVTLDGKKSYLSNLRNGDFVKLKFENGEIDEVTAKSEDIKIRGDILKIKRDKDYDNNYVVEVEDDNETHKILLDSRTKVERDRSSARREDLREGDDVYIIARYDVKNDIYLAEDVDAKIVTKKVKGWVLEISNRLNRNPMVTIKNRDNDKEETYELTSNAYIRVDKKTVSTLPSNPGYEIELYVSSGKEITEAYADSISMESSIIGRIEEISYREDYIDVEIQNISENLGKNKFIKIYIEDKTTIIDKNLKELELEDLYREDTIMAVGVYKGASFVADTVQLR